MAMFGIDAYTFETVWPSLTLIVLMVGALVWGYVKVRKLIDEDSKK